MITFPADPSDGAGATVPEQTRVPDARVRPVANSFAGPRETARADAGTDAQRTKLPLRHLAALERDDFAVLPAGMYRRAEVRAYAEAVGLDRTAALSALDRSLETAAPHTGAGVHVSVPHRSTRRSRVWMAAALAFAASVIACGVGASPRTRDVASAVPASNVAASPDPRGDVDAVLAAPLPALSRSRARFRAPIEPARAPVSIRRGKTIHPIASRQGRRRGAAACRNDRATGRARDREWDPLGITPVGFATSLPGRSSCA